MPTLSTPARLGAYAAGLVVAFGASYGIAAAVVPPSAADGWSTADTAHAGATSSSGAAHADAASSSGAAHADAAGHEMTGTAMDSGAATSPSVDPVRGLLVEQDGVVLRSVDAPREPGVPGRLTFTVAGPGGPAVTAFDVVHDKTLHLVVVRSDGTGFRHVHPTMDAAGAWSLPWEWETAGSYRIFADFAPTATGRSTTLTSTVDVAGDYRPAAVPPVTTEAAVDGFDVTVAGSLTVGAEAGLSVTVHRDGRPVTTLQPYLGAYGHLVVLRAGDLGYLHVHPEGAPPAPGAVAGPTVDFMTTAPTAGRYFLYVDFQVDDVVHSAALVLDAEAR